MVNGCSTVCLNVSYPRINLMSYANGSNLMWIRQKTVSGFIRCHAIPATRWKFGEPCLSPNRPSRSLFNGMLRGISEILAKPMMSLAASIGFSVGFSRNLSYTLGRQKCQIANPSQTTPRSSSRYGFYRGAPYSLGKPIEWKQFLRSHGSLLFTYPTR
jgi:hypothetical protein